MSQDIRRERAGVSFETIAGATQYIAQLEQENHELKYLREDDKSEIVELTVELENRSHRIETLEAENLHLKGAFDYNAALARESEYLRSQLDRLYRMESNIQDLKTRALDYCDRPDAQHLLVAHHWIWRELVKILNGTY